jgi:ankyrin repeat protein
LEVVRLLIEKSVDVNKADNNGDTPLYWAALRGHLEVVKLLIENNANISLAHDLAIKRGETRIAELLNKTTKTSTQLPTKASTIPTSIQLPTTSIQLPVQTSVPLPIETTVSANTPSILEPIKRTLAVSEPKFKNLTIVFNDLQLVETIGEGSYGIVWKAIWNGAGGGIEVAVKKFLSQKLSAELCKDLESEVNAMR